MSAEAVVAEPHADEVPATETLSAVVPEPEPAPVKEEAKPAVVGTAGEPSGEGEGGLKKVEDMTEEELKEKVLQQVEFYFSESNLPFDKFLFTLSYKDNPEHWVSVGTIASFKRMRDYTAAKGTSYVSEALKASTLLELSEDGEKVRRKVPLEDLEHRGGHDAFARSVYAKGFGEETPTLQRELEDFFSKFGKWNVVRMRRDKETKAFKSSVFVEWVDLSAANKFLALDPKPQWKGTELVIMSKKAYCDMKIAEKGIDVTKEPLKRGARGGSVLDGDEQRKASDFNGWKIINRQRRDEKAKKDADRPEVYIDLEGEKVKLSKDGKVEVKELEGKYKKGVLMAFEGAGGSVPWGDIKDPLKETFPRIYVEFQRGAKVGFVLLGKGGEKGAEQPPLESLTEEQIELVKEKVKTIGGKDITWRLATAEEEQKYWLDRANYIAGRAYKHSKPHDRGGRGGRQNGRGGHSDRGRGRGFAPKGEGRGRPESVPTIKSTLAAPAKVEAAPAASVKMDVDEAAVKSKRKLEDGAVDAPEPKKAKVEEAAAA
ncbi:hypothetical protein CALCODRAFT_481462 [Calocera cornea HHB12733]|uniref:HTH La-type RNA-binding domain-containing protein n=1 Tax=Calocera cornea HHB12733 TaxID=1353952 RepID=A0A165HPP5_9BASI|nr:hypothetical protein CALCODRAFT_481462 [Calocera cornea HHB12733]